MSRTKLLSQDWSGIEQIDGDRHWLEEVLKKIFPVYDPFKPVVSSDIAVRSLLFPTDMYHLDQSQFQALRAAVEATLEQRFYISQIEWQPDPFERGSHWLCYRPSFEDYTLLPMGVENAIYSPDGSWGILLSHELHAFLACGESFWKEFNKHYPQTEIDRSEFLEYWAHYQREDTYDVWQKRFLNLLNR